MTGLVTYRQLLDEAASALTGLHTLVSVPNRDPADAAATMVAWRWFVTTAVRHTELLAPHDAVVTSLPRLHPARGTARAVVRTSLHPAGQALMSSCELLGLAHDVLASHLGPERQHRSPEASLIEESGVASPAMRTLSSLLLTAAVAHQELARRAMDVQPAGEATVVILNAEIATVWHVSRPVEPCDVRTYLATDFAPPSGVTLRPPQISAALPRGRRSIAVWELACSPKSQSTSGGSRARSSGHTLRGPGGRDTTWPTETASPSWHQCSRRPTGLTYSADVRFQWGALQSSGRVASSQRDNLPRKPTNLLRDTGG